MQRNSLGGYCNDGLGWVGVREVVRIYLDLGYILKVARGALLIDFLCGDY